MMGVWIKSILIGYFLVQSVDYDDGQYNICLQQVENIHKNLVAAWTKDKDEFKEGTIVHVKIEGECSRVYEVLEGNGKIGSPWRPEDDWYLNDRPWICNADTVEILDD